jgi:hypothetical protein
LGLNPMKISVAEFYGKRVFHFVLVSILEPPYLMKTENIYALPIRV